MMTTCPLGSVVSINPDSVGKNYPYPEIEYIDISSVGSGTLEGKTQFPISEAPSRAKRLVKEGDTILSTVRPNRRSFLYIKHPVPNLIVSTGFAVLRPSEKIDSRFLFYAVTEQKITDYLTANAKGAAYPAVDTETIGRAKIKLPPLPTQRKIASILSAYDDLIENNTRRIKILEKMAQMIYWEWFVKFRFPGANVETSRRGVSNPLNETRHRHVSTKMVDSAMGEIPKGWEVGKLQDFVELCYGKALKAEERKEGPYPVYGSSGVVGYHSESLIDGPGIIVGRKGNVGSVHWTNEPFYPIDTVYYVKTNISLYYTFYNLQQQNFINNDAAVPGLNRNQAYALPFLMPPKKLMTAFDDFCTMVFGTVRNLMNKNQNLRKTRDLLLPRLISGEVDVEGLEILTES